MKVMSDAINLIECPTCKGNKLIRMFLEKYAHLGEQVVTCETCKGKGKINSDDCPVVVTDQPDGLREPKLDFFSDDIKNLEILQEECAEVIQAVSKIKRFGFKDHHPNDPNKITNIKNLIIEISHVLAVIDIIKAHHSEITDADIEVLKEEKIIKLRRYY